MNKKLNKKHELIARLLVWGYDWGAIKEILKWY